MGKVKHNEISKYYSDFIESFLKVENEKFDLDTTEISESIFKHIFRMKCSLWKHSIIFNRRIRISMSDLFQDIVSLYLKLSLGEEYEVILEEKIGKLRPDILIKYKGQNLFIIEIKTTIGWDRELLNGSIQKRIEDLSETFNISRDNIVYIFMSPWNVSKKFGAKYWDKDRDRPNPLPEEFPYNKIRPLLTNDDAYYFKHKKGFDRQTDYIEYSEKQIDELAKKSVVIPLELTIKEIIKTAEKMKTLNRKKMNKTFSKVNELIKGVTILSKKQKKNKASMSIDEPVHPQNEKVSRQKQTKRDYNIFWTELKQRIETVLDVKLKDPTVGEYYKLETGIKKLHFEWCFHGEKEASPLGVELHSEHENVELNKKRYNILEQYLPELEIKLNKKAIRDTEWSKNAHTKFYFDSGKNKSDDELMNFAVNTMLEMYNYFMPVIEKEKANLS